MLWIAVWGEEGSILPFFLMISHFSINIIYFTVVLPLQIHYCRFPFAFLSQILHFNCLLKNRWFAPIHHRSAHLNEYFLATTEPTTLLSCTPLAKDSLETFTSNTFTIMIIIITFGFNESD